MFLLTVPRWYFFCGSFLCLLCLCAHLFICALWSPTGKGLASWLLFVGSHCKFVTFPLVSIGQVWYLIVLSPDLCTLTYFVNLCPPGKCFMLYCCLLSADYFQNNFLRKILSGISSDCQTLWIQIRPNILLGLIWVQTFCKGYQQTSLRGKVIENKNFSGV